MSDQIVNFLKRIDEDLASLNSGAERLDLYLLGRSALVLFFGFSLSTRDVDIIQMRNSTLEDTMIERFGQGTLAAKETGLFIDPVGPGLPPVPGWFRKRCEEISGDWKVLRLWKLEAHDLAVTKLKSFRPQDREDLQRLCDRGLLDAKHLRASLDSAFQFFVPGKDDEDDPDPSDSRNQSHTRRSLPQWCAIALEAVRIFSKNPDAGQVMYQSITSRPP